MKIRRAEAQEQKNDGFTSMIDIVFLLLIFFLLQPFKAPEMKLASELPQAAPITTVFTQPLVMKLDIQPDPADSGGVVYSVDGKLVGRSRYQAAGLLPSILTKRSGGMADTPVQIRAYPQVAFQHVVAALDACYAAQMTDVRWTPADPSYVPAYQR